MEYETIYSLNEHFRKKDLTTLTLVKALIKRIEDKDPLINAVTVLNPHALDEARVLDQERAEQGPKGPLHGIPVLLKDNINTLAPMATTAGSLALKDVMTPYEATLVKNLKQAGALILGKVNLSEFAYFMSRNNMPSGFSSLKGQVKSPYHETIDPLGSSTGSAVAVAMGYAPVTIGTETNGSIIAPCYQNGVVGIKPTVGLVSRHGIVPISPFQDTAGPIARSVRDAALVLEYIKGRDALDHATLEIPDTALDYANAFKTPIKNKRLGLLRLKGHTYTPEEEKLMRDVVEIYRPLGLEILELVFEAKENPNYDSMLYEFKFSLEAYLDSLGDATPMKTIQDIVTFNAADPAVRMPYGQTILEDALKISGDLNDPAYLTARTNSVKAAQTFTDLYEEHRLDAMISLHWLSYGPVVGHPSVTVPAKVINDDHPRSMVFTAPPWQEPLLIGLAYAYEQATHAFTPPPPTPMKA